jgi:hypothetical protein
MVVTKRKDATVKAPDYIIEYWLRRETVYKTVRVPFPSLFLLLSTFFIPFLVSLLVYYLIPYANSGSPTVPFHVHSCRPQVDLPALLSTSISIPTLFYRLDMFAYGFVTLFFVALVAVNVVGHPVPLPIQVRCCHLFGRCMENADGFVSEPWLSAVLRRLNLYRLM